jgi:hypothetical protein
MDNLSDPQQYSESNIGSSHLFKQKFFLLLFLPPLIAVIGFVLYTSNKNIGFDNRSKASSAPASIEFNPTNKSVNPGDTFTLGISLNTGDDTVTATELHLSYDPELQVESFNKSDYLPVILNVASFGNGKATLVLGCDPTVPRKGSGIIATISFKALTVGSPSVRFDQETQVAALGKDSNALLQLPAPAQITILRSATINPFLSPNPTTTATPTPTTGANLPTNTPSANNPCVNRLSGNCLLNDDTIGTCKKHQCVPIATSATPAIPQPTTTATSTAHCLPLGNLNCNEKVDIFDYNRMLHDFGTTGTNLPADLNDNGKVDLQDFNKLLFNFNKAK